MAPWTNADTGGFSNVSTPGYQKGTPRVPFDFHSGGERGMEPDSDPHSDRQVTDSENNLVPRDPPKTP
jgi:hypothetical protein